MYREWRGVDGHSPLFCNFGRECRTKQLAKCLARLWLGVTGTTDCRADVAAARDVQLLAIEELRADRLTPLFGLPKNPYEYGNSVIMLKPRYDLLSVLISKWAGLFVVVGSCDVRCVLCDEQGRTTRNGMHTRHLMKVVS